MTPSASVVTSARLSIEEFFGCKINEVNRTLQMMALHEPPPPDWLSPLRRFDDLPRVNQSADYRERIRIPLISQEDIAERTKWIVENCNFGWNMKDGFWGFESPTEAVYFRLRYDF